MTILRRMPKLGVVVASVREGRAGRPVADWFIEQARTHGHFDVDDVDLKVVNLPMFAERNHPRLHQYESEHQKAWAARVESLDAFVFVAPEYNYSTAPPLLNALDYLLAEWRYKAVGLVSYGGISAGLRAAQMVKQTVAALKMVAIPEAVSIPFIGQAIDKDTGVFKATESQNKSAGAMLDELTRWTAALAPLRA
jgi:NAD(P)H-dependent FMN reductase